MAETITKGYLIYRKDYELFDEIISFINQHGNIFSTIALGVKKILSKNSRNLFYGCLTEFIFFASRDIDNKIGKLKKVILLENNINLSTRMPLFLFNYIIFKNKLKGKHIFEQIKKLILILKEYDESFDSSIALYILIKSTKYLGIKLNLDTCAFCDSKLIYSFSFENNGFVCKKHFDGIYDYKVFDEVIKIIYLAKQKLFHLVSNFDNKYLQIAIRILIDYINQKTGINLYSYLFNSSKIA